ncbi:Endoglucanase D precursor [compost metagenome]
MNQTSNTPVPLRRSISVNQLGYPAEAAKSFVYAGSGGEFEMIDTVSGEVVYRSTTGPAQQDEASGTTVCRGDFGELRTSGTYRVSLNGESSAAFVIAGNPYADLQQGLLKAFYYLRCGMELEESIAGPWKHHACHTSEGIVYDDPSLRLDSRGGWHDAGDYGKYTGPGAKAVTDLLLAYEGNPNGRFRCRKAMIGHRMCYTNAGTSWNGCLKCRTRARAAPFTS